MILSPFGRTAETAEAGWLYLGRAGKELICCTCHLPPVPVPVIPRSISVPRVRRRHLLTSSSRWHPLRPCGPQRPACPPRQIAMISNRRGWHRFPLPAQQKRLTGLQVGLSSGRHYENYAQSTRWHQHGNGASMTLSASFALFHWCRTDFSGRYSTWVFIRTLFSRSYLVRSPTYILQCCP